ncbi:MAG: DUF21 domain-containing protein [Flavobacterium sp.]|nr:MAG: DUF21 domain-containing protein [Flavobacterium sp.]
MITVSAIAWFFVTWMMMSFFAGVEMAFYSVNRFGIELRKKQGRSDAILLSKYFENPELFLSTMLIGFTIFLVSFALLFTSIANHLWDIWGLRIEWLRVALNIILATFIILVFGEFIPRALFRAHSNFLLSRLVWIVNILYQFLQPIARLFLAMANWTLKYIFNLRIRETKENLSGNISETLFQQGDDPDFEPIPAVPESMSATDLIGKFTKERKSIAWVVDEFGGTAGIVTMEDVLEEIFGEIHDEYDSEEFVEKQLAENEYIFSGRLELDYICEKYDLDFPDNESETLSGFIISHHETIPHQKERIIIDDFEFDILSVSDTRIEMVKLKVLK